MPVDPHVQQLLDAMAARAAARIELTADGLRSMYAMQSAQLQPLPMATVDAAVPGPAGPIPVRAYTPDGAAPDGPTIVWYHGGGWVLGDLDTHHAPCTRLAAASGMRLISVDYRLAPEHPFPAAAEDAFAAFAAIIDGALGGPPSWVAVAGDSAGGNLAAVVCLKARDGATRAPDFQLLVYPVVDGVTIRPSRTDNGTGYGLTTASMDWLWQQYVPDGRRNDPYASPMCAPTLAGLPPAHVVTAEYDLLRDEGEAYADALSHAGVTARAVRYDGQVHGFFGGPEQYGPTGQRVVDDVAAVLRAAAG